MADAAAMVREGLRVGLDPAAPQLAPEAEPVPDYLEERARLEHERARLLRLERLEREAALIPAEVAATAWADACRLAREAMGRIPARVALACPRLDSEGVAVVAELLAEALEGLEGVALPAG